MPSFKNEFYGGSLMLTPLADLVGLPIDQVNFLVCQLVALAFAFRFRHSFSVESVGVHTRHVIETCVGVFLTVWCFGYQIFHLLAQSLVSYAFMAYGGSKWSHKLVFVFSMLYLSVCHIYRQIYDYGGYTLDITGPLMIQTQKLTSLAFALHDGRYKKESDLSNDQKGQAVKTLPTLMQYLSFMFYFHGIMVGPLAFYNDYIAFIDGSNFTKAGINATAKRKHLDDVNKVVIRKLLVASACCAGMLILPGFFFPPEKLNTPEFYNMNFIHRIFFLLGVLTFARFKYYFAWILSDALNNAAGFGFNGFDASGNAKWDLTNNVDIAGVELSTSLKVNVESWNTKTALWLRRVVYDRASYQNTLAVFATSAFWHGFYPGYYITFGSGAAMTLAARKVRRHIRPFFQTSANLRNFYDVITFTATRFVNSYVVFPFLTLEFYASLHMYRSLYFHFHILTILALQFFAFYPGAKKPAPNRSQASTSSNSEQAPKPANSEQAPKPANSEQAPKPANSEQAPKPANSEQAPIPADGEQPPYSTNSAGSLVDLPQNGESSKDK